MTPLRDYQLKIKGDIRGAWQKGARNVLAVAPCGAGKTVNMAEENTVEPGASIDIAHRSELVSQMSLALARNQVRHRIVGPDSLIKTCVRIHMEEVGASYYHPQSQVGVAGVDTLVGREANDPWFNQIRLWQTDEAHHVLKNNKWGRACELFPNARGIGWTATPVRADGKGLGAHADGIMHDMILGPSARDLITRGYLTDYRIFCPPSDLDLSNVDLSAGGDFSPLQLREATHASSVVGDIVKHYLRIAPGKLGITFAVDVEDATKIAAAYRAAGVPAEVVTAKTPDALRAAILRRFRRRELLQLVNVDLFGEGFDVPAIEVVSMGRATASFALYAQQFFRTLRLLEGKFFGIIIDHVGNVIRHGVPDRPRIWTLDQRERASRSSSDLGVVPGRACAGCTRYYERTCHQCPYCGHIPEPGGRGSPDQVDGDLMELDPTVLAALRGEVQRIDGVSRIPSGLSGPAARAVHNHHLTRQQRQAPLRAYMDHWAWWRDRQGDDHHAIQRRFFFEFGIDVMTARTLGAKDADELCNRVAYALAIAGVLVH